MNSPSQKSNEQSHSPSCLDISPDRLNKMSPSELADAMEKALDFMTEETYDPDVISAYLDALDQRVPIPEHPNADAAYGKLQQKLKEVSIISELPEHQTAHSHSSGRRSIWRTGLVAALLAFTLFGGLIIAQACGLDVFGAMARWTDDFFSFGELQSDDSMNITSAASEGLRVNSEDMVAEVSEEYRDVKAALEEHGLPFRLPQIPEGFEIVESSLYIAPTDKSVQFSVMYKRNDDCLIYQMIQNKGQPRMVYEKDSSEVKVYEYNDIPHYIITNEEDTISTWIIDNFEYSLSSNTDSVDLEQLIKSFY